MRSGGLAMFLLLAIAAPAAGQTPPSQAQIARYEGLHRAAHYGETGGIARLAASGANLEARDANGRTAFHVAAFARRPEALAALAAAGADANALDADRYDAATIAAVADDAATLRAALAAGNRPGNVTSRYDGTALIAAAHLGHHEAVRILLEAGAPPDHVNNLGWTALIEAVVLGDGGADHRATAALLLAAGADRTIRDRQGRTPLELARERGYGEMAHVLEAD